MGVRIDSSVSAAKASAQQAAAKKDGQPPAAGTDTDFSQVLAKARPKKKVDAAPPSDKPAPVGKATGKKKAKAKDDPADDARPVTPGDRPANRAKVEGHGDDAASVDDTEADTSPVAVADDDDDAKSDTDTTADEERTTANSVPQVIPDRPGPVVTQAAPTPAPVQSSAEPVAAGAPTAKAVTAAPVDNQPAFGNADSLPAKDQKGVEVPAEHEVEDTKPTAAPEEPKAAIHPTNQPQRDQASADGQQQDGPEVRGQAKPNASQVAAAASPAARFNELFQTAADRMSDPGTEKSADKTPSPGDVTLATAATGNTPAPKVADTKPAQPPAAPVAPDVRFAADNHPKVVTAVKSQLLPGGGSIQLRLDPPDLGPLRLEVRMEDGSMSASFVTASDQATSLLTHTLGPTEARPSRGPGSASTSSRSARGRPTSSPTAPTSGSSSRGPPATSRPPGRSSSAARCSTACGERSPAATRSTWSRRGIESLNDRSIESLEEALEGVS